MSDEEHSGPFGVAEHSGPFGQVPSRLLFDKRLSAEAKIVYGALACHADQDHYCYPRQAGLAHAIGCNQRTISHHLAELVKYGWIISEWLVIGGRRRHCYYLRFQPHRTNGVSTNGVGTNGVSTKNIPVYEHRDGGEGSAVWDRGEEEHSGADAPATPSAPRESALKHPPEQHPLYAAATEALRATPRTEGERKLWTRLLNSLARAGVTASEFPRLVRAWHRTFPQATPTLPALDKWLGTIDPTPILRPTLAPVTAPRTPAVQPPAPPTYAEWLARRPPGEQATYEAKPAWGRHSYQSYCRERGMEPQL